MSLVLSYTCPWSLDHGVSHTIFSFMKPKLSQQHFLAILKCLVREAFIKEQTHSQDYMGEHQAPTKHSGAPMHNLTGIYPDDIYSSNASQLYSSGEAYDSEVLNIIRAVRNKPKAKVKVYRAVPLTQSTQEQISDLENQKRHILKTGKLPPATAKTTTLNKSAYYDIISDKLDSLKSKPPTESPKLSIEQGNWVALSKHYAVDHGKNHLNGKYRILSKLVPASTLYTDGNSIQEWGYDPS